MGWIIEDDHPKAYDHEGFVVGVVKVDWLWHELGLDDAESARPTPIALSWVQVGCECGWRSQRLVAPFETTWSPCSVFFRRDDLEEEFVAVWKSEHRARLDEPELARRNQYRHQLGLVPL